MQQLTEVVSNKVMSKMDEKLKAWSDSAITQMIDKMESTLERSASKAVESTRKKLKLDNPDLKKEGNKSQFKYNNEVLEEIERAESELIRGDGDASLAHLKKGKKIINKRQKLVKLADREEGGWRFVNKYEQDNLASDSEDDEKKIKKARKECEVEKAKTQSKRSAFVSDSTQGYRQSNRVPGTDFRRDRYERACHKCNQHGLAYDFPDVAKQ